MAWRHPDESHPNLRLRNGHVWSLSPQTYSRATNRCAWKQAWMTISPNHWISFICRMRCCDAFRSEARRNFEYRQLALALARKLLDDGVSGSYRRLRQMLHIIGSHSASDLRSVGAFNQSGWEITGTSQPGAPYEQYMRLSALALFLILAPPFPCTRKLRSRNRGRVSRQGMPASNTVRSERPPYRAAAQAVIRSYSSHVLDVLVRPPPARRLRC
jgi:hypothetical protein